MSFEGFYQRICANGHYFTSDAIAERYGDLEMVCECGAPTATDNLVDETNFCGALASGECQCHERAVATDSNGKTVFGDFLKHPH